LDRPLVLPLSLWLVIGKRPAGCLIQVTHTRQPCLIYQLSTRHPAERLRTFDTGDDCIAIKSGKNPEGNVVNRPTENVRISDCRFIRGHGISIGSEMSGGVRGVLIEDCVAGALLNGLQIKGTKERAWREFSRAR
jgi:hypothetical protein